MRERMSWNPFDNAQGVYRVNECPAREYTDAVRASFADYGDAAVFVFARSGGEQNDLNLTSDESGGSFLSLTDDEAGVLQMLQDDPAFDKIIVLVNTAICRSWAGWRITPKSRPASGSAMWDRAA